MTSITPDPLDALRRPKLPYRWKVALGLTGGTLLGVMAFGVYGIPLSGYAVDGDPLQLEATYRTPTIAIIVTAGIGTTVIAAGFMSFIGDNWKQFLVMAAGVGFLATGITGQVSQRITITPEGFSVRDPWHVGSRTYRFDELNRLWIQTTPRPWSRFGDLRTLRYELKSGDQGTLCRSLTRRPIWNMAAPHLLRGKPVIDPDSIGQMH